MAARGDTVGATVDADMRKSWPIITGVVIVGAISGVAIADRSPAIEGTFMIDPQSVTTPTSADTTTPAPDTTASPPTTAAVTSTVDSTIVIVVGGDTDPLRPTTTADSSTEPDTPAGDVRPRTEVRVVVANGDGRFNLAGVNGSRLEAAGYTQVDLTDAGKVDATVVYFRPTFDREAAIVAADLLVPNAIIEPLPDTPVTSNDDLGDVVVVLGPDAIR